MKFILYFILIIILTTSCSEPLGVEKSINISNLSEYKYFKIRIGTELEYNVIDYDESENMISSPKKEIWKVEKIELIDNYNSYKINIYDEGLNYSHTINIAPNNNLLALYTNNFQNFSYRNSSLDSNYNKIFNYNWLILSKSRNNWQDSVLLLNDTIKLYDDINKSNENFVRTVYLVNTGTYEYIENSNITDNENLKNQINSKIFEAYFPVNPVSNNSVKSLILVSESNHYFEYTENGGLMRIISEIKELNKSTSNQNNLNYTYKKRVKELVNYKY